jgi:hypothetical protein
MTFHVYEPETVRALSEALEAAMAHIEMTAPKTLLFRGRSAVTKALVTRLLLAADSGECDPEKLRALALNWAAANFRPAPESRERRLPSREYAQLQVASHLEGLGARTGH